MKIKRYRMTTIINDDASVATSMMQDPEGPYILLDDLQKMLWADLTVQPDPEPATPKEEAEAYDDLPDELVQELSKPTQKKISESTEKKNKWYWTKAETKFLQDNIAKMTWNELTIALKRDRDAIKNKAQKLGIYNRYKEGKEPEPELIVTTKDNPFIRRIPESAKPGSGRIVRPMGEGA